MERLPALHKYHMSHTLFTYLPVLMGTLSDLGSSHRAGSVESAEREDKG